MSHSRQHKVDIKPYTKVMNWYRRNNLFIPGFNQVARKGLKMKYERDKNQVAQYLKGKEQEFEEWLGQTEFFFGFSSPRSGTVFLADILISEFTNAHVEHEANVDDYLNYTEVLQRPEAADEYVERFRLHEIFFRLKGRQVGIYGEVNPFFRHHAGALQKALPSAKIFHIIRDGRAVVRSLMSREILGKNDPMLALIQPPPDDPYRKKWHKMSRLERVCWQWQYDNRYLRETTGYTVKFEDFRSSYDVFRAQILDYIGAGIPKEHFENYIKNRQNETPKYRMPVWEEWTSSQQKAFEHICGEEMAANGYDFR